MIKLPSFSKASTIKNDPFAAVIPEPSDEPPPRAAPARLAVKQTPVRKKLTVHLRPDVIERVKNAAYWNPRLTIAAIAEAGIVHALEEIERDYGGAYPAREQELRGGRPIK
jgi:hypothetical protein